MITTPNITNCRAFLVSALVSAFATIGHAQTTTEWNGDGGTGSWFNDLNWVGEARPPSNATSDVLIAGATSGSVASPMTVSSTRTVRTITFDDAAGHFPNTLNFDTNPSGTTDRTLTLHGGITLSNTTKTVSFRGNNGVLTLALAANNIFDVSAGAQLQILNNVLVTGTSSIEKTGTGSLLMGTGKTFSGDFILSEGRLRTNGSSSASGGVITSGPFGTGILTLKGGILQAFGTISRVYHNSVLIDGDFILGGLAPDDSTVTARQTFSTLGGGFTTLATGTHTLDIQSEVIWNQAIGGAGGLVKMGNELLTLGGVNTFSGGLEIAAGELTLGTGAEVRFNLADGGLSNAITGIGAATFDGVFRIDAATVTDSVGSWQLVGVNTLTESFGASFGLSFVGSEDLFDDAGGGVYSAGDWTFDTSTGMLSVIPEPSAFAVLLGVGVLGWTVVGRRRRMA